MGPFGRTLFQTAGTASEDTRNENELRRFEEQKVSVSFRMFFSRKRSPNSKRYKQEGILLPAYKEAWGPWGQGSKVGQYSKSTLSKARLWPSFCSAILLCWLPSRHQDGCQSSSLRLHPHLRAACKGRENSANSLLFRTRQPFPPPCTDPSSHVIA